MAYNSSKGPQQHGDIKFEGDPLETQIDFENDFIALKASGSQVLVVSGTHVGVLTASPAAHPSGKNDFVIGNQSGHRGATIASGPTSISTLRFTYATAANNGEGWIDYSNNSKKMRFGTNGLNTRMTISDTDISSSLNISASAFYANGALVTAPPITTYSNAANNRVITSVNSTSVQGEAGLTYNGSILAATGEISASLGVTGSSLRTATTIIDATHISSSLNISGSKFYGDGSTLTGTMHTFALRGDSGIQTIYNGESVTIAGGTGLTSIAAATDTVTINLDNTSVSAGSYTYSAITVDDQGRLTAASSGTGPAITTYSNAANNRVITSVDATSVNSEAGLLYNGSKLTATGEISASLGVTGSSVRTATTVIDTTHVSSSLNVSGAALYVDVPGLMEIHKSDNGHAQLRTQTAHFQIRNKANNKDIRFQLGEDAGATGVKVRNNSSAEVASIDSQGDAILRHLSASLGITGSSLHTPTTVINATHVSSSLHVSASKFFANGVEVGGGGAVTTYTNAADNRIITSVNSNTINGEARLTFNGSTNFLFLSGNAQVRNHLPTIFFSNSAGTGLGYMGYNSSDNILFQNNVANKHIVFKANDNGVVREGFRLDGGVPEVVVNQGSDSLVDFRVESDNNTHMIFSDGANDRVGINTGTPTHTLSVTGSTSLSGSTFVTGSLTTLGEIRGKQLYYTHHHFVGAANNSYFPFVTTTENTNANEAHAMVVPHDGRLVKILYRVENAQNTSFTLKLIRGVNGVKEIDSGGAVEVEAMTATLPAVTASTVTFTSSGSLHYFAGDIVGIKNGVFQTGTGDVLATCVWEYDQLIP